MSANIWLSQVTSKLKKENLEMTQPVTLFHSAKPLNTPFDVLFRFERFGDLTDPGSSCAWHLLNWGTKNKPRCRSLKRNV